ncbi:hypothetical protein GYMLUDRAFT_259462 [Collybiopsis luxurians FD-317 M1]|uniref:Phosphoglucomutase n=1 Tax=Collybiopsis luxurians FD-317 M1 TaxID=944289 RepID=A0A0D0D3B5_9AGAR|nr:hypothetical protein GYMLUDRAFT_259462 [Collybiopsis luxurians FD-317 M1]
MIIPIALDSLWIPTESPKDYVEVAGYDLWMTFIKNVHDVPEALNIENFKAALSKSLAIYRHACGRLLKESVDGSATWKIRLTDSPILLEIVNVEELLHFTDSVIQDNLVSFLPDTSEVTNIDSPLLRLKLHLSSRRTIIGIAWHHTLGDAATLLRFMITLSDCYQGSEPESNSLPTFRKHRFSEPLSMDIPTWLPHMSHLAHTYSASEIGAKYTEGDEVVIPIRAMIRRSEADVLRTKIQATLNPDSMVRLSIQDCLTAIIVSAINSLRPNAVSRVTNAAGFRQVRAEWNDPNIAGNSIYIVSTQDFAPEFAHDPRHVATVIRESLVAARQAGYVTGYMNVAGHLMALAADKQEHFFFGSDPTTVSVNSNFVLNWQAADFGHPKTRFFTPGITRFYLRAFTANPTPSYGKGEAIDLTFGAPASLRQGIIERLGPEFLVNEATRSEIQSLWDKGDTAELERRMKPRIEFGTAGLRGKMEAGWARMNDLIIIQASQGLCKYVLSQVKDAPSRGIVIGHDHRYNSEKWAQLTAAVFIEQGVKVYLYRGLVHTPLVPFGVKNLNAACGVMITASHNPKNDNGYKVYWENAVQIIAPHDKGISDAIQANLSPKVWSVDKVPTSSICLDVTEDTKEKYFSAIELLKLPQYVRFAIVDVEYSRSSYCVDIRYTPSEKPLVFVNTSMHGVGHPFVTRALQSYHITVNPVEEQMLPDPAFPTLTFPNPEEKGALDLAIEQAKACRADYVLAQDPDSDRFSACQLHPTGEVTTFTGDQLGTVFAALVFETYRDTGKPLSKLAMVASAVSSKMVEAIAMKEGFKFVECLTGFKYIGNTALDLVSKGYEVPFGYEEAIGFMFGSEIRDKDGVASSVMFAQLAENLHHQGKTVKSYLEDLYERYGYFKTLNSYFVCNDTQIINAIFARLRNYRGLKLVTEPNYPQYIAGVDITRVVDLTIGYDSANPPSYQPSLPLSSGHMIQFRGEQRSEGTKIVLTVRTSGTEPKIKYYLEGSGKDSSVVSGLLTRVVSALSDDWMQAQVYNLGKP